MGPEEGPMHQTSNHRQPSTPDQPIVLDDPRLADAIDLQARRRQPQAQVKDADLIALNDLFDRLSADVESFVDRAAGR
jgi:hypothetical protein